MALTVYSSIGTGLPGHRVTTTDPVCDPVFKTVYNSIKDNQSHFFSAWQPCFSVYFIC